MEQDSRIYVAGTETFIGTAIESELIRRGFSKVISHPLGLQLTDMTQVCRFFRTARPEYVFMAAGETGGIAANQKYPARLMLNNLLVETNVISAAYEHGTKKLLYLASSCVYPRDCVQPMVESAVLAGALEPTNEAYAVAKIAGMKLCQAYNQQFGDEQFNTKFVTCIPANVFGPGDDFDPEEGHVIPSLIRKMHDAKISGVHTVDVWGSGTPRREFIFSEDLADACVSIMADYEDSQPINVGVGTDLSIKELAQRIQKTVAYTGELKFDTTRPDGIPAKLLDSTRLADRGWQPKNSLSDALMATYQWYATKGPGSKALDTAHGNQA